MGEGSLVHTVAIIGVACAAILVGAAATWYLLGALFPPESDDSILTLMPNDGLNAVGYADVKGEGIERLANYLGDVMGGKYLRGITGARIAIFNYTGDTGFVVYIQNKNKADLMSTISSTYGSSYSGSMFTTVNQTIGGKDVTILYSSSDYSQSSAYCLWEEGGYLKMMGFTQNSYYGYGSNAPRNLHSCTDVLAQTYDSSASKAMLARANDLESMAGAGGTLYANVKYAAANDEALYATVFGDAEGTYLLMVSRNPGNAHDSSNSVCAEPSSSYGSGTKELVQQNGKAACFQDGSGTSLLSIFGGGNYMVFERRAGEYKLIAGAMVSGSAAAVKSTLSQAVFSANLPSPEAVWKNTTSYTIRVYSNYGSDRLSGANVELSVRGNVVESKVTNSQGEATFDNVALNGASVEVTKSGYQTETETLYYSGYSDYTTVYLSSNEPYPTPTPWWTSGTGYDESSSSTEITFDSAGLNRTTIINAAGVPQYKLVVGEEAKGKDVASAGNIAAVIGALSHRTQAVTAYNDAGTCKPSVDSVIVPAELTSAFTGMVITDTDAIGYSGNMIAVGSGYRDMVNNDVLDEIIRSSGIDMYTNPVVVRAIGTNRIAVAGLTEADARTAADQFIQALIAARGGASIIYSNFRVTEGGVPTTKIVVAEDGTSGESIGGANIAMEIGNSAFNVVPITASLVGGQCVPSRNSTVIQTDLDTSTIKFVIQDRDAASTSAHIIVIGSDEVNTVASEIINSQDIILTKGQAVVKVVGTNILIAGGTADDTARAANAFINWLAGKNQTFTGGSGLNGSVITSCGLTLRSAGAYTLESDLSSSGTCITIQTGASGSTIDCKGHRITGPGNATDYSGILALSNPRNLIIKNCVIEGFGYGIWLHPASSSTVTNNTVQHDGTGIQVDARQVASWAVGNTISNNNCSYNENYGINVYTDAEDTIVRGNNCSNTRVHNGIIHTEADSGVLTDNIACSSNGASQLYCRAGDWTGSGNTCTSPDCSGVTCQPCTSQPSAGGVPTPTPVSGGGLAGGTQITSAMVPYTIRTPGTYYLSGNVACSVSGANACILINASGVTLDCQSNSITSSCCNGVHSCNCGLGVHLNNVSGVTVRNCRASGFNSGIQADYATASTISGGVFSNNGYHGMYVANGRNNTLTGNTVSGNLDHGISLYLTTDNRINDNVVSDNAYRGISVWNSSRNTLANNRIPDDNYYGIELTDGSFSTTLTNNFACGSGPDFQCYGNTYSILSAIGNTCDMENCVGLSCADSCP